MFKLLQFYILLVFLSFPFNYILSSIFPSLQTTNFTMTDAIICSVIVVFSVFLLSGLISGFIGLVKNYRFPYLQNIITGIWVLAHVFPFIIMFTLEPIAS